MESINYSYRPCLKKIANDFQMVSDSTYSNIIQINCRCKKPQIQIIDLERYC